MDPSEAKFRAEYSDIADQMTNSDLFGTPAMVKLAKRQAELIPLIELYERRLRLSTDIESSREMLSDSELGDIAREELPGLEAKIEQVNSDLRLALVPKDPNDVRTAIVEIRAGAGGDEASLFAGELYRMYARFAEVRNWRIELVSESPSDVGGYKEVVFEVTGNEPYGWLKYESGVHRVQRVPATESGGRIHTSTVTVAVLPEADETDLEINQNDLRIDVYRSGGNGGQSVNTTDSAVRITHLPTGTVVAIQDEKSQLKNKLKAMSVLRSRLLAAKEAEELQANREARQGMIGTGDRSEKIRTYNFPQDRVTDHRIGFSRHNLPIFMDGQIGDMIEAIRAEDLRLKLEGAAE
ncbi:MAG: peptide chain release factor 1 [Candidatus Saccharibacteria bacterium]